MANSESKEFVSIQFQCEFCEEILADIFEWKQHRADTHSMEYIPNASQAKLSTNDKIVIFLFMLFYFMSQGYLIF